MNIRCVHSVRFYLTVLLIFEVFSVAAQEVNKRVHTFYYNWYATPEKDGTYQHWNHQILPHWSDTTWNHAGSYPGGDDIGANFYPTLGCYSSRDTAVIAIHMEWIKRAGIGVVVITWWGKQSAGDSLIPLYLNAAAKEGLSVAFHIEPFYKTANEFREQITYLTDTYGNHPAFYRRDGKAFYYVYDSYKLQPEEWQKILHPQGENTLRKTKYDGLFVGLWVEQHHGMNLKQAGFDGVYTYFASDGFVYGSTTSNWPQMAKFATENKLLFIPCSGPGYSDTRIRPWNAGNFKNREDGAYYKRMMKAALEVKPDFVGITSFNEWHEGTQIEPANHWKTEGFIYEDYGKFKPDYYLNLTARLLRKF